MEYHVCVCCNRSVSGEQRAVTEKRQAKAGVLTDVPCLLLTAYRLRQQYFVYQFVCGFPFPDHM